MAPAFAPAGAAQPAARQVLLLNSFERGSATENLFAGMLRTELGRQSPEPINFFEVSLQPALAPDDPREEPVVDYLVSTFGQHLDLVVTMGGPAAEFAQRYRERIFPATPLLLTAMDQRWVEGRTLAVNETALGVVTDPERIIDDILRVLPDTRNIFVVIGASRIEATAGATSSARRFQPLRGPRDVHLVQRTLVREHAETQRVSPAAFRDPLPAPGCGCERRVAAGGTDARGDACGRERADVWHVRHPGRPRHRRRLGDLSR